MAPRPLESFEAFMERAQEAIAAGQSQIYFGYSHWDAFALCAEEGLYSIRKMEIDETAHAAFLEEKGYFMPENSLAVSKPGTSVLEAHSLQELFLLMKQPEHRDTWGLRSP